MIYLIKYSCSAICNDSLDSITYGSPVNLCVLAAADPGFSQGGPQVLRQKVGDVAKWSCGSEANNLRLLSMVDVRALEAFGF